MIRIHADVIPWSLRSGSQSRGGHRAINVVAGSVAALRISAELRLMKSQFAITEIPLDSTRGDMGRLEKTERIAETALPIPFAH